MVDGVTPVNPKSDLLENVVVLVPVAPLGRTKSRLGPLLTLAQRRELTIAMVRDVLDACAEARANGWIRDVVVCHRGNGEATIEEITRARGLHFLKEPPVGDLDGIIAAMTRYAQQELAADASILVFSDLPLLAARNFSAVARQLARVERAILLCPSLNDGVSFLARKPPAVVPTRFNTDTAHLSSFQAHVDTARAADIPVLLHDSLSAFFDVDLPLDLALVQHYLEITKPESHTLAVLARVLEGWEVRRGQTTRDLVLAKKPPN